MMCERDSYRDSISYKRYSTEERNCYKFSTVNSAHIETHTTSSSNNNSNSQTMKAAMELSFSPATTNNTSESSALHRNSSATSFNISTTSSSSTSSSSSSSSSQAPQSSASIGVNLRVTGQCSQGGRKYMEDYFSVAYQQSEYTKDLEYAFVGIYDGHGGAEAATFAKEHLMMEIINQKLFWSDSDQDVLRAIREGYIATHYAMWREQDKWPKTATGLPSTAGTTATVAFIRREKIYIGHVGDSGIVLGYQNDNEHFWRAKQLTTDHKPESLAERTRIMRSGGKVVVKSGVPRVVWNRPRKVGHKGPVRRNTPVDEIPFLAVARSLGDLWSYNSERNEFIVSPDPDVKVIKINPKTFRCLIFGTDGLWNVVTPQEAVDSVREKELINERLQAQRGESTAEGSQGQWTNPSKGLVEKALRTWSSKKMRADNTSVVTVILYPPGTNIKDNTSNCHTHSYGLEYTQVNAEIPNHDDETTYAEMANKYLPPEEYRNFKYDEDEEEEPDIDPLQTTYIPYSTMGYDSYQPSLASAHDYYDPLALHPAHEEIIEAGADADNDEEDEEDDEEDFEEENVENGFHKDCTAQNTNYTNELPICSSRVSMHPKLIEQDSLDYMNSFAESYTDSLLSGQMDNTESILGNSSLSNTSDSRCSDTTSSSSSNSSSYHSSVYHHNQVEQHEIIMEHQQYQELCMSQEEGYSLTKLETRGEQQMRNGKESGAAAKEVQTFKIFQQHQETSTSTDNYNAATPADELYDIPPGKELFYDPRLPALVEFINSYKPKLELNSVLQQEMEEEQQVAMERLEMQRKAKQESQPPAPPELSTELEETICEEYLEEEHLAPEELTTALDESIQINEISSSIESPASSSPCEEEMEVDALEEDVEMALKVTKNPDKIVLLEKIEILQDKPELVIESTPSAVMNVVVPATATATPQPQPPPQAPAPAPVPSHTKVVRAKPYTKAHSKSFINPSPSKRSHFPNVPNENQRLSLPCSSSSLRSACHVASYDALLQHQITEKRQLRSTAPITVDYTKRTLRSRNSLSKDMKAKSTLNLRRSTSISSQYLRTTAASLLATSSASQQQAQQQQQQQQQHQQQRQRANPSVRSAQKPAAPSAASLSVSAHGCKPAVVTTSTPALTSHGLAAPPHAINLRSRQVVPLAPAVVNAAAVVAPTTVTIQSSGGAQQRRERRNLRSFSTRSAAAAAAAGKEQSSFSKTTRLQSSVASLAAPPPSPKLICAATRGRSLLPSKTSVTSSADFGKRSTLRSGTLGTAGGASVSATTLQTRSRVQKRLNR